MKTHPLAEELNEQINQSAPHVREMLSGLGCDLYFPKGILTQSAEAKQKATRCNATIGIAREHGKAMHLESVMEQFADLSPDDVLPYAPATGLPELRERWGEDMLRKNPSLDGKSISLPVVTSGVTHGLSLVGDLFVERADMILLPDMAWGNYRMIYGVRRGAEPLRYPLFSDSGGFNTGGFASALARHADRGTLIVLLNFPNNPTGYSPTEPEANAICDAIATAAENGCNILAVCDDAYFGLFYDDSCLKESMFARLAGIHERVLAVKLDGATKEDFVWGLRVGFLTFGAKHEGSLYEALEKKVGGAIRGSISSCSRASQAVLLKAMTGESYEREKQEKFNILGRRALKVKDVLGQDRYASAWTAYPFNSGYFMCLKLNGIDAEAFRVRLLEDHGIGVIAISQSDVRVAFSCVEEEEIPALFDQMFLCAREMADSLPTPQNANEPRK